MIPVIFDRVFHEVRNDHDHLDLIDLRVDLSHTDHSQLDVPLLRDGAKSSEDKLNHFIDVALLDIEPGVLPVHADKGEQFRNDLVFAVYLVLDVDHELPVHLDRNIFLLHQ